MFLIAGILVYNDFMFILAKDLFAMFILSIQHNIKNRNWTIT